MKLVVSLMPSPRMNAARMVASGSKDVAHGSFKRVAFTRTMRVYWSIEPAGNGLSMASSVSKLTHELID
jgi:hypothetical protein